MEKIIKINKDVVDLYENYKKDIPCFNGACLVAPSCCTVKKASKKAKYLAYTITLGKSCEEADNIFTPLSNISKSNKRLQQHIFKSKLIISSIETNLNYIEMNLSALKYPGQYII